jgi:chromate transporter
LVAFLPSFSFVLLGAARFERLLVNERVIAFLAGAAPAAAGAIIGSTIPLAAALSETWQYAVLVAAALALLLLRRGVVVTLLAAGTVGAAAGLLGAPLPH